LISVVVMSGLKSGRWIVLYIHAAFICTGIGN